MVFYFFRRDFMKITESITANISLKEIEAMIQENASKEGYDVTKVTPEYEKEYSRDPRESGMVTGQKLTGFKVDLRRKQVPTKRSITQSAATRDWFDINDR
jgi:hypothetical protein